MTAHAAERPVSTSAAPPPSTAGTTISGFLLKSARVYEDVVTLALREALSANTSHCVLQAPDHLYENHALPIVPHSSTTPMTAPRTPRPDTKYQAENPEGFPNPDLYQMLAYCTAPDLPNGHRVRLTGITIHQHTLALGQPPAPCSPTREASPRPPATNNRNNTEQMIRNGPSATTAIEATSRSTDQPPPSSADSHHGPNARSCR